MNVSSPLRRYLPLTILIVVFGFLFFYKLGVTYLDNWDEAWYGSIAREIVRSKDFIHLKWNGALFVDQPPLGCWLMAISYMMFGITEFSTRFPSALLGLCSLILLYLLSYSLFKKRSLAFVSSCILGSSVWYLLKVRSGNLDSSLIFFYLLTAYLSVKSSKNIRFLPVTFLSYGMLILTKTLVGLPMGILIIFWNLKHITRLRWVALSLCIFLLTVSIWYVPNIITNPDFIHRHFFVIGLRQRGLENFFQFSLGRSLFYLHNGIGRWYYPFLLSLFISIIFVFRKKQRKELLFVVLWVFLVSLPFVTSNETQIWHLIPLYIPIALLIPYCLDRLISIVRISAINTILILSMSIVLSVSNIQRYYKDIFPGDRYIPDEAEIALDAGKYPGPIYLNSEFTPRVVFYSGRNVEVFARSSTSLEQMISSVKRNNMKQLIITHENNEDIIKNHGVHFERLSQRGNYVLLQVEE